MEIYGSVSFQSSVSKYLRIRNFPVVCKIIYGSVSEAGEFGHRVEAEVDH